MKWKSLTLDDLKDQFCNINCIGCSASSIATAKLSCFLLTWLIWVTWSQITFDSIQTTPGGHQQTKHRDKMMANAGCRKKVVHQWKRLLFSEFLCVNFDFIVIIFEWTILLLNRPLINVRWVYCRPILFNLQNCRE